jgi:1,4-dihydroxy-2-naphthoate polyprenyltransferase
MQTRISAFRSRLWDFIRLSRVVFLLGGFLLYAIGAAAAVRFGFVFNWPEYLLGQVVVTSIQLMGQYLNEYYDIEVDRLTDARRTWFSGGSGILSKGRISPAAVLVAARICAMIALFAGIMASLHSVWMVPIIILSLLGSWFYSSPPLSLMSSGWGELTTSIIVAMLVPMAGYFMQGGFPPGELWLVVLPLIMVHTAMLISFEFPDYSSDLTVGKKTLAVRLGLKGTAWMVTGLIGTAFLFLIVQALSSKSAGQWMVWAVPLAIWQMVFIHRVIKSSTRTNYYLLTTGAVALFVLTALLTLLGFVFAV